MDPEFWHERWRLNQIGFHRQEFSTHLQVFWEWLELPPQGRVFVPLCGKSRDMLWLRSHGHPVLGVELSEIAVRDFFVENDRRPQVSQHGPFAVWECDGIALWCGDFFDLRATDLRDCMGVYDRASLVALPPLMRGHYARQLQAVLPHQVAILLVTMEYPEGEMQGPPFGVLEEEVEALYADDFVLDRLYQQEMLKENPALRDRGLSALVEKVYRLRRRSPKQ